MKKTLFCLAATCMFAMSSLAQTSATSSGTQSTTTGSQSTKKAGAAKEKTLTGCIEAGSEANEYVLKTGSSKKPIELMSSEDLKAHVGHTVKVTGKWSSEASEKKEMGGSSSEQAEHKEAAGAHHFMADKVEMVSDTCNMGKANKSQTPKS